MTEPLGGGPLAASAQGRPVGNTPPPTEYVILLAEGDLWDTLEPQTARSAEQAVKQAAQAQLAAHGSADGTYVAVPARSWKPTTVKVETAFKIGGAS